MLATAATAFDKQQLRGTIGLSIWLALLLKDPNTTGTRNTETQLYIYKDKVYTR